MLQRTDPPTQSGLCSTGPGESKTDDDVLLRCAAADVLLGHLLPGSLRTHAGDKIAVGDWLAAVGNSGNTGEPHLHVHAQGRGPAAAPLGGDPLPIQFNGRHPVRGDRICLDGILPV